MKPRIDPAAARQIVDRLSAEAICDRLANSGPNGPQTTDLLMACSMIESQSVLLAEQQRKRLSDTPMLAYFAGALRAIAIDAPDDYAESRIRRIADAAAHAAGVTLPEKPDEPEWAAAEAARLCKLATKATAEDLEIEIRKSLRVAFVMTRLPLEAERAYAVISVNDDETNAAIEFATERPPSREVLNKIAHALTMMARDMKRQAEITHADQ